MQGNAKWQAREIMKYVDQRSQDKHELKAEARENGAKTWHEVGKEIGVQGVTTFKDYTNIVRAIFDFAKEEYGIRDITKVTEQHVQAFLVDRIEYGGRSGDGVERATFDKYASAIEKFEQALNRYAEKNETGKQYDFQLKEVRAYAAQELGARNDVSRAYADPQKLVDAMSNKTGLVAKVCYEAGCRISEVSSIRSGIDKNGQPYMRGISPDKNTGEMKGWCSVKGKGGKIRLVGMSPGTYAKVEKALNQEGRFSFDHKNFRGALEKFSGKTGQTYEGPHGLRWSWAQERHSELQKNGMSYEASLSEVSREMGHERSDITCHYLK